MKPEYVPKTLEAALGKLVEEAGEVLAAVGKSQRWGLWSSNPEPDTDGELNIDWILREVVDLTEAIYIAREFLLDEKGYADPIAGSEMTTAYFEEPVDDKWVGEAPASSSFEVPEVSKDV